MNNKELKQQAVIFLGDSTSMTVGLQRESYPFHLSSLARWQQGVVFVNSSQPGITSADATSFFFNKALTQYDPRAVVVYLGNCDANATELNKGIYSSRKQWGEWIRKSFGRPYPGISLKNKLLRFEWNASWDARFEHAEPAVCLEANLERVFVACRSRKIPVILVKPVANRLFPAGLGKGNFSFYSFLEIADSIADEFVIPDPRFIQARRYEERGEPQEAMRIYSDILDHPLSSFSHLEYPLLVVNNYAVCAAKAGRGKEAERLWLLLLKERSVRREIVLYNLACLYRQQGRLPQADDLFSKAYDEDVSLYRVKSQYIQALERLAQKFQGTVHCIDMATFIDNNAFADHCHLFPEGQRKLAASIKEALDDQKILSGKGSAKIINALYNPEFALGNHREFFEYYKTYAPFSLEQIKHQITLLKAAKIDWSSQTDIAVPGVSFELIRAVKYYLGHPCFLSIEDVLRFAPNHPGDLGPFPELYLIRHILPYIHALEGNTMLFNKFLPYQGMWYSSQDQLRVLPPDMAQLPLENYPVDRKQDLQRITRIIDRVEKDLLEHINKGPQVAERLRTTMFWYFRELLRWGSHSRVSMRYDRRSLEYCMEALIVAGVFNEQLGAGELGSILKLADKVFQTVKVHENFCARFDLQGDHSQILREYSCALQEIGNTSSLEYSRKDL